MGDIGKGTAMHQRRIVFQGLHQVRLHRFFQEHGHGAVGLEITGKDRRLVTAIADDDGAQAPLKVFEIGGPDQLSYRDMLRVAAEVQTGHPVPIITVPVLTPRLSSYWLALVTDVDVTTGRNLIDSMGTEVLVTDDAIRGIVPGDPVPYAEAVRRAIEERRASLA